MLVIVSRNLAQSPPRGLDVFNKLRHLQRKATMVRAKLEWVIKHLSGEELETYL